MPSRNAEKPSSGGDPRYESLRGGFPRILLYSHDSWGLGHLRRNLTIASALGSSFPDASVLLVTGSPCATFFPTLPRVEVIKLPSITKDEDGSYVPRSLPGSLTFALELRQRLLFEAFQAFEPQLVIIDHQVIGLHGEALRLLREARRQGIATILGLRDVIDSVDVVTRDWDSSECRWALTEGYDRVCVYGAPEVFDPRVEYPLPLDHGEVVFTGYVVRDGAPLSRRPVPSTRPQVLVTIGGGEDGAGFVDAYLESLELSAPDWDSVIVTGPLLETRRARRIKRRASLLPSVQVHRFHGDVPRLLHESNAVVSMAGYNTCAEILSSGKPSVLLPRTHPRREQHIRAERFEKLGLAKCRVKPRPVELREAVEEALERGSVSAQVPSLAGCRRLCDVAGELLSVPAREEGTE